MVAGFIAVKNVLAQASSPRRHGADYAADVLWPGFAYGLVDGLMLSVLPVLAVTESMESMGWTSDGIGHIGLGVIALAASLIVTAAYHLGYPEFRGRNVLWALLGNGVFTIAYLLTGNALAAVLPHIAMHIAAITHGPETTVQLPPHYEDRKTSSMDTSASAA